MRSAPLAAVLLSMAAVRTFAQEAVPESSPAPSDRPTLRLGRAELRDVEVAAGSQLMREVALENPGPLAAHLRRMTVAGKGVTIALVKGSARFKIELDQPLTIEIPGASQARLQVIFNSKEVAKGERKATITIESDAPTLELPIDWEVVEPRRDETDDRPTSRFKTDLSKFAGSGPPPIFKCDPLQHDFEKVHAGEHLKTEFKLRNDGEGDLVIVKVGTQCHCTLAQLVLPSGVVPKKTLASTECYGTLKPGEEATLQAEVDTAGMGGFTRKKIEIVTSDLARSPMTVWMTMTVDNPFRFTPSMVRFNDVQRARPAERVVRMASVDLGRFAITGYELPDPQPFDVDFREVTPRKDEQCAWELVLRSREELPTKEYLGKLRLNLDHEKIKVLDQLQYQMRVLPDIQWTFEKRASPETINLGIVRPGTNDVQSLTLENGNPKVPYVPTSVQIVSPVGNEPYELELVEVEKGQRYVVTIHVVKPPKTRAFKGQLVIQADHPTVPELKIGFTGIYAAGVPAAPQGGAPPPDSKKDGGGNGGH